MTLKPQFDSRISLGTIIAAGVSVVSFIFMAGVGYTVHKLTVDYLSDQMTVLSARVEAHGEALRMIQLQIGREEVESTHRANQMADVRAEISQVNKKLDELARDFRRQAP